MPEITVPAYLNVDDAISDAWVDGVVDILTFFSVRGADLASASTLPAQTHHHHRVTGTTAIDNLTAGTKNGKPIKLQFVSGPITLRHNSGGTGNLRLAGGVDAILSAGSVIELVWDGTAWYEASRTLGGGVGLVPIFDVTLGSSQASIDSNTILGGNIPQIYKHLVMEYQARSDQAAANSSNVLMRLNNDSGANYDYHELYGASTNPNAQNSAVTGQTSAYVGDIAAAAAQANRPGQGMLKIVNYTGTTFYKTTRSEGHFITAAVAGFFLAQGLWANTGAVTRLALFLASGNFLAGSRFTLYGEA